MGETSGRRISAEGPGADTSTLILGLDRYAAILFQQSLQSHHQLEHFAPQPETEKYINYICDKFGLRENIQFNTRVKTAKWETDRWTVTDEKGRSLSSQFLITGIGVLSNPTLPNVSGVESFKGEAFHTARWPHEVRQTAPPTPILMSFL